MNAQNRSSSVVRAMLRRSVARRSQRGAAVFIVVMAIVLLTGIGVFAARTASMVDVAAGFDRQAMQTYHLSELAGRTLAGDVAGGGDVVAMMLDPNLPIQPCLANRNPSTGLTEPDVGCHKISHPTFDQHIAKSFTGQTLLAAQSAAADGSLGPRLGVADTFSTPLEGQVLIEVTDPNNKGEMPGSASELEVTVTAHAQIRPTGVAGQPWCASQTSSMGASVQVLRAHISVPKPPQPTNQSY